MTCYLFLDLIPSYIKIVKVVKAMLARNVVIFVIQKHYLFSDRLQQTLYRINDNVLLCN